ncbi:hypothetical protein K445DRAFT_323056 [Daldinia sp. EC12]|nr:hypothetical protein K445DRAFT_323056 [Daldinia sp. EC12]
MYILPFLCFRRIVCLVLVVGLHARWSSSSAATQPYTIGASYLDLLNEFADASYQLQLKERNGSSRQQLKKYVKANNTINVTDKMFDSLFNKALKAGVDKGIFEQPKGASCLANVYLRNNTGVGY